MSLFAPMYHSIAHESSDNLFALHARDFDAHLRWLKMSGHQPVTLAQIADWLSGRGSLPRQAYIITFDDGYLDNLEYALPLLQKYQATACIFISTGWSAEEKRQFSPLGQEDLPMLTWSELKYLASQGVEIGAHTVTHPFLPQLDHESAWKEISQCKRDIEEKVGVEVLAFSYPNSKYTQEIKELVRQAGYTLAFGGGTTLNQRTRDRYALTRPCIYNGCSAMEFGLSICTGLHARQHYWDWRKRLLSQAVPKLTPSSRNHLR